MNNSLFTKDFFNFSHSLAGEMLQKYTHPWEALKDISSIIMELSETLDPNIYEKRGENIWVAKSATIYPNIYIAGPCIIGEHTEVRPGAFIRGNALVGNNCVVGNSTELKNVILFDNVQVPHFNYVGDSIFGYKSHTGAGAITSNVKQDKSLVTVNTAEGKTETHLKKFGAILGDHVEIGCNTVMNPGTVIGKNSRVYPLTMVRGFVPANHICKNSGEIKEIK